MNERENAQYRFSARFVAMLQNKYPDRTLNDCWSI